MAYSCCYFGFLLSNHLFFFSFFLRMLNTFLVSLHYYYPTFLTSLNGNIKIFLKRNHCRIWFGSIKILKGKSILIINCKWKRCPDNEPIAHISIWQKNREKITVKMYRKCVVIPCFYHRSLQIQTIDKCQGKYEIFLTFSSLSQHKMI